MENTTGIILFVDSEEEICRHYKHMEDNNGIVEWGCNVPIKAYELKLPFYAYMYITRGEGIKYRCRVRSKRSKSNLISPDDETNVPEYYCSQKHITWLKFDMIEKLERIVYLNEFKLLKGGQSSPRPSIGGYRGIIDDVEVESVPFKLNDCPSKDKIIPLEDDYSEKDVELHFAKYPQELEMGLELIERQYHTLYGPIDLLMKDKNDTFVVVECKLDADSKTLAQIIDYMSWIEKENSQEIRGLIVCNFYENRLKNSIEWLKSHGININIISYEPKPKESFGYDYEPIIIEAIELWNKLDESLTIQQLREMKNILTNKLLDIKDEPDSENKQECIDEVDITTERISRFISQKEKE